MDILARIERDHETQRTLMAAIEKTEGDTTERRETFKTFAAEFRAHAAAEEHAYYAELMKVQESTDQSRHSVQEHAEALEILETLEQLDMSAPEWLKKFKTLSHDNEHHMNEEEDEVFPLSKKALGQKELDRLGGVFDERKNAELDA